MNAGALLPLSETDWLNLSHDKDYILGLVDRFCHVTLTQIVNQCLVFKNY